MTEEKVPLRFFDAAGKVGQTVRLMAVLPDRLQDRIVKAFISQWSRIKPEDFPPELRDDFERIDKRMTARPITTPGQGRIHATVLIMNDDEARDLAETICTFAHDVRSFAERYRYDRDLRAELDEQLLSIIDASGPTN